MRIREAVRPGVAGMVTNPIEGKVGGYGINSYKERAEFASAMGLEFVNIALTLANARNIRDGGAVSATRWNGASMEQVRVPAQDLKAVYVYAGFHLIEGEEYKGVIKALSDTGKRFVNGPETIAICDDKGRSQALFEELGVRAPITAEYDRKAAAALLSESGFIFIKDTVGSMGDGQATVLAERGTITVKVDSDKTAFGSAAKALGFVEETLGSQRLIVQEGIRVKRVMGRVFDFRAMLQADYSGEPSMHAAFARIGADGLDQANCSKGGIAMDPYLFHPSFQSLGAEMERTGREIFKGLQRKTGAVGELGIDFLLSDRNEVIVLEINGKPGTDGSIRGLMSDTKRDSGLSLRTDSHAPTDEEITQGWKEKMATLVSNPVAYLKYLVENADA